MYIMRHFPQVGLLAVLLLSATTVHAKPEYLISNGASTCGDCHTDGKTIANAAARSGLTSFCKTKYPAGTGAYSTTFVCTAVTPKPTTPPVVVTPPPVTPKPTTPPVVVTPPPVTPKPTTPPVVVTPPPVTPKPTTPPVVLTTSRIKPVISAVADEWVVEDGHTLTIPVSVKDPEADNFTVIVPPSLGLIKKGVAQGAGLPPELSDVYVAKNGLPTIDVSWSFVSSDTYSKYNITLYVQETVSKQQLKSKPISVLVTVTGQDATDGVNNNVDGD
jgi:hypothetical protein